MIEKEVIVEKIIEKEVEKIVEVIPKDHVSYL